MDYFIAGCVESGSEDDFHSNFLGDLQASGSCEGLDPWNSPLHSSSSSSRSSSTIDDKMDVFDQLPSNLTLHENFTEMSELFFSNSPTQVHPSTVEVGTVQLTANSPVDTSLPSAAPHNTISCNTSTNGIISNDSSNRTLTACSPMFIKTEDSITSPWNSETEVNVNCSTSFPKFKIVKTEPKANPTSSVFSFVTPGRRGSTTSCGNNNKLVFTTTINNMSNTNTIITNGANTSGIQLSPVNCITTIKSSPPASPPSIISQSSVTLSPQALGVGPSPRFKVLSITNNNTKSPLSVLGTRTITKTKKIQPKITVRGLEQTAGLLHLASPPHGGNTSPIASVLSKPSPMASFIPSLPTPSTTPAPRLG